MSETQLPTGKRGLAPVIRKMAAQYPELSHGEIAEAVGCSRQNVSGVVASFLAGTDPARLRDFQENKAEVFDAIQLRLLSSLTQEKLDKSKPMEIITGAAILEDKARLIRGLATGINVNVLLDVAEAIRQKRDQSAGNPRVIDGAS